MANLLQAFNDSQLGVVLGTVLHTLGAIAFLGGLVGYIAWHRHLRSGHHHRNVLATSAFLTYIAIVVNLVGGFMRTYETGHPHITEFGSSAWVRAIVIKHVFLFVAYGAAIVLFEVIAPRHLKAFKAGTLATLPQAGHRVGVLLVTLGILVSAFLGAVTQILPIAAAEMDDENPGETTDLPPLYVNTTGQLTSTLVAPATSTSSFQVPSGTASLNATLTWSPDQFVLAIALISPSGQATPSVADGSGRAIAEVGAPAPGTWEYRISSDLAVNVAWRLSIAMPQDFAGTGFVADSVTIAPGQFYEVNTQAPANGSLNWDWSASAVIHFDVHTHFDEQVQYVVEEQVAASTGSYFVNRTGGHSYLWENTGTLPVTLDYRVWGDFELDSIFPA